MRLKPRTDTDPRISENRQAFYRIVKACGDSQRNAAAQIGVTQAALSKWIARGWCSPERAVQLEKKFGVPRRNLVKPSLLDAMFN